MTTAAGSRSTLNVFVYASVILMVLLWTIPTLGLFVSSFRHADQIASDGWWTAFSASQRNIIVRSSLSGQHKRDDGNYVLQGNVFEKPESQQSSDSPQRSEGEVKKFGVSSKQPTAFSIGDRAEMKKGMMLSVQGNGDYELISPEEITTKRGPRFFVTVVEPPGFTASNYRKVFFSEGLGRSFLNTATVTIPATIIPILIAAFAAYALSWMEFPGRALLIALVVGLLVVPLQMALIPLLKLHNQLGIGKTYVGIWLAHTGFGLPLAIYLLRNYISGLPREIIDNARVDGATDFDIFRRIVLPLSYPALAAFAIFQFLWVWNDLLVATVFLGNNETQLVMTGRLRELIGSRGGEWELLAASAFVSICVPLIVFFSFQRFLVRGLLAGSVKGG